MEHMFRICGKESFMKARNKKLILFLPVFIILIVTGYSYAFNETHLDKSKLPLGCSSCHKSHGKRATVMLERSKDELCLKCHGTVKKGLKGESMTDIFSVILKRSNHPIIQTTHYHILGEDLPEKSPSDPRHSSCFDCHNPHLLTSKQPLRGVRGYSGRGIAIKNAQYEYEVCYKCHSTSANISTDSNIAEKLNPGNASFHPVETIGMNRNVPSLERKYSTVSMITCSDCHGNDDKSGPKGPHGSSYEFILKENYNLESGPESPRSYELCYSCHRRSSILNDESFKAHKRHVVFGNVSCFACHDSHGSRNYENLINFDTRIVAPNSQGQLAFMTLVPGKPRCFLSCHVGGVNYEHKLSGGEFCINSVCIPFW